ncbi:MAG: hypothetical protein KTR24_14295 [Saprospiraceae bacterium]|nr:hypothetical protein [Saprospiraceae bacterium]
MRLIKTVRHPIYLISIFLNGDHYLIQIENGRTRVAVKADRHSHSVEEIEQWVLAPIVLNTAASSLRMLEQILPRERGYEAHEDEII